MAFSRHITPGPSLPEFGQTAGTVAVGDDARFPTAAEKDAFAGTAGTPSDENRFVTDTDTRLTDDRDPTAHTHAQSEITDLVTDLAAKAAASHVHVVGDVTGLQTALDGKTATGHAHAASDITSGILAVARGGTGTATPGTAGNLLTSDGAGGWTSLAPASSGLAEPGNTPYDGFTPIFDEDLGTKWVPGVGFEANWKSPTAGPFDLTDGDAMVIRVSYSGGSSTDIQTFTVNTGDVSNINAVTVDELVNIIAVDCPRLGAYKDPDTNQLVIYLAGDRNPSWTPDSYMIATSVSATLATALGVNAYDYAFGSGGTPAIVTSANSAPFTLTGQTLSVVVNGDLIATDAFLAADDTAAEVASRINGTVALAGKVYAFPVGNTVRIIRESASEKDYLQINSGGANTGLAFPTTSQVGVGNALAETLRQVEQLSRVMVGILADAHEIASLGTTSGAIAIDMAGGAVQNLTINDTSSFTVTNIDSTGFSYTIQIFITGSGTRTVSFDTDWKWIGSKPTEIADGVTGCLTLSNKGSANTDITAEYAIVSDGSAGVTSLPHAASHQNGGSDEIATATPGANAIPKADGSGKLDGWVSAASTTVPGLVELATDGQTDSGVAVQGDDARLALAASAGYLRDMQLFGDGSDGVVSISSGTTTLTRPMNYSTLTLSGSGALRTQAYPVMCSVELDVSSAPANAITYLAGTGGNGAATTTGGSAATNATNHLPAGQPSTPGGAGGTAAGSQATNLTAQVGPICGGIAASGAGGLGASGAGAAGRANVAPATTQWQPFVVRGPLDPWLRIAAAIFAGGSGQSGGGGGGDGTQGGGGGAGGQGGQFVGLWTKLLRRSGSSAAGAISATGGTGGNGGSPAAGDRGGGGGGGAGSGGCVYVVAGGLAGSSATDLLSATGGVGGTGGAKSGTGVDGTGGTGGYGGLCVLFNLSTGTVSKTDNRGTAGTGPTGRTGGPGTSTLLTV